MNMKKIKYIIYLFVAMLATTSCEDFLNITPDGQSKRDPQLSTAQGIEDAMYGVYSQMRSTSLYGQELYYHTLEILAHNLYCDDDDVLEALARFEYKNTDVKSIFEGIWTTMYKNISNVNSVLDAPLVANATEYPFKIYRGEALGLRAFMHFDLVRLFAEQYTQNSKADGIPYATEFSLKTPEFESLAKNYEHILADLLEAELLLDDENEYEGVSNYMLDRQIHFNKYAVWATLARVYLTMGDKVNAAKYAKKVIDDGKYMLKDETEVINDLAGILSKKECLFGIYFSGFYANVVAKLQQTTSFYSLDIRKDFKEIYDSNSSGGDYRFSSYFTESSTDSNAKYRLSKFTDIYEMNNNTANRPADHILGINMIRIPEMYYIMAEVMLEENPEKALEYYNEVRKNRGLEPLEENIEFDISLINEERFKEMIGEGQTFFNLKRLNLPIKKAIIMNSSEATEYQPSKEIYVVPIPDSEIENRN